MEVEVGQRRQYRESGKIFRVIKEKESPCKWLWVTKNELDGGKRRLMKTESLNVFLT